MNELSRDHKLVGRRIRKVRLEASMSQEDLGYAIGISATYMGSIERGERNLTVTRLLKIARALKTNPAEFLAGLK